LSEIGAKETQQSVSESLAKFGDDHRQAKNYGVKMIKRVKPVSYLLKKNWFSFQLT
jgi:hypothetical protein